MIQVYTGNGKGKTTAALGLAIRAAGAGFKVYICQFLKGRAYCELLSLKKFRNIKVEQFGKACFLRQAPRKEDMEQARSGLAAAKKAIESRRYSLVVLDEINVALKLKLVSLKDTLSIIKDAPKDMEIVLTGRSCPRQIVSQADLVSNIQEVKHYYRRGLKARRGIEL